MRLKLANVFWTLVVVRVTVGAGTVVELLPITILIIEFDKLYEFLFEPSK